MLATALFAVCLCRSLPLYYSGSLHYAIAVAGACIDLILTNAVIDNQIVWANESRDGGQKNG